MNASRKKLLVVASSLNPELLRTPHDLGLFVVLAATTPPTDSSLYDHHLPVDELDPEAMSAAVAAYVAEGNRIDAVACFHEGALRSAARVTADLGLPGNSPQAVMAMRDKNLTPTVLAAAGIRAPRTRVVASADEAVAAAQEFGFPVVLKPQSSASSQGVAKASSPAAVAGVYAELAGLHQRPDIRQGPYVTSNIAKIFMDPALTGVLVQEHIDGPEYAIDLVYANGEFFVLGIHDKPFEWAGDYFIEQIYATPTTLAPQQEAELVEVAVRALQAVGATTGAAHVEIRLSPQGPTVIEVNGRLGGTTAYVQESIRACTGIWGPRAYLQAVLGQRPEATPTRRVPTGFVAILAERTGRIERYEGVDETLALPGVQGIRWMHPPGADVVIDYPANPAICVALVLATGDSRDQVMATLAEAERTLRPILTGDLVGSGGGPA